MQTVSAVGLQYREEMRKLFRLSKWFYVNTCTKGTDHFSFVLFP